VRPNHERSRAENYILVNKFAFCAIFACVYIKDTHCFFNSPSSCALPKRKQASKPTVGSETRALVGSKPFLLFLQKGSSPQKEILSLCQIFAYQLDVILMHLKGQGQGYLSFFLSVLKNMRVSYEKNSLDDPVFFSRV